MQILSIRGENIASLAKPFEIRLDEAPLSLAGLFAITGETGAGKSSLLDAMCLAIYGDCPRLSGDGTRETVEDIDGQTLKSNDARMALRRGASSGFAEVTFRAADGEVYAVGWQVRRARDKIDGRLQSVERSLFRISDKLMLETQLSRVNEKVVELTGLTYDEFRRTILLAQGEFDAFLGAKTDERAAILEKVTGTEIYRDISRRVFDRHRDAMSAVSKLETRRGEHRLLTEVERGELDSSIKSLRNVQNAAAAALNAVNANLDTYKAFETAKAHLAAASERVTRAGLSIADLHNDRKLMTAWDSAQGLRGEVRELQEATQAQDEARKDCETLYGQHENKKGEVSKAETLFGTANAERTTAEKAFKAFGPDWDNAADIDSQILTAETEHGVAIKELADLRNEEADPREVQLGLLEQQSALKKTLETEKNSMKRTPGYETLLSNWGVIEERLEARFEQAYLISHSEAEVERLSGAIAADQSRRNKLDEGIKSADDRIAGAHTSQLEIKEERERLFEAEPSARLERLGQVVIDLRTLRQTGDAVRRADEDQTGCLNRLEAARRALADHKKDENDASVKREEAERLIEALRQPTEAASAAASREAEHLRRHLVDGEPCPVCRSKTHPVMNDGEIARLADNLRNRFASAQKKWETASADATNAKTKITVFEEVIATETANEPKLTAQIEHNIVDYCRALEPLKNSSISGELPLNPRTPDDHYEAQLGRLTGWRIHLEGDRNRLEELNRINREAFEVVETDTNQIVICEAEKRKIDERILLTEKIIASNEQTTKTATTTINTIDRKLAPLLKQTSYSTDIFDNDGARRFDELRQHIANLSETQRQINKGNEDLTGLDAPLAKAEAALAAAKYNRESAERAEDSRGKALQELSEKRKALLGGEETGVHRTRHNNWRTAAQGELDKAQANLALLKTDLASLISALNSATGVEKKSGNRAMAANTTLAEACRVAELDFERVLELHAIDDAIVQNCRKRLKDADTESANAEGARKEREDEFETLKSKGLPETPKEALEARSQAIEAETSERGEALGRLSQQLDADVQAAKLLSGLEAEIEAARKISETWTAVNDAVGSAKGDRFAQIAQAVTLALLVERANLHLDDLKPRYQLQVASSDLALHVIDRDMAGDARPTRLLSGGERFLVSLALALALSGMGNHGALAGTLFIDEGFGSLDSDSLDLAIDALERLQAQGRTIGVISHVQAMKDRISVQLQVVKTGGGASEVCLFVR